MTLDHFYTCWTNITSPPYIHRFHVLCPQQSDNSKHSFPCSLVQYDRLFSLTLHHCCSSCTGDDTYHLAAGPYTNMTNLTACSNGSLQKIKYGHGSLFSSVSGHDFGSPAGLFFL